MQNSEQNSGYTSFLLKTLGILIGIGAITAIGYLTDTPEDKKKGGGGTKTKKAYPQTKEEFQRLSPEEQKELIEQFQKENQQGMSQTEQQIQKLLEAAEAAKQRGDFKRAEDSYKQAIKLLEQDPQHGPNHYYVGLSSYALSLVYKSQDQLDKSAQIMERAISILEQNLSVHPEITDQIADALATLADVYITLKKFDKAEPPLTKAIAIVNAKNEVIKNFESKNPAQEKEKADELKKIQQELGILFDTYSKLRFEQKKYAEAEDIGTKAILILQSAFRGDKQAEPLIHRSFMRLSEILLIQGKETQATEIYNNLLKEKEKDGNDATVASYCRIFAKTCREKGMLVGSIPFYEKALPLLEKSTGKYSTADLLEVLADLISIHTQLANDAAATEYRTRLLAKLEEKRASPPLFISKFLRTANAVVEFAHNETDKNVFHPYFSITLDILASSSLEEGSVLVFSFPGDEGSVQEVEQTVTAEQKQIQCKSPQLNKVTEAFYPVDITIYQNSSKDNKLGSHLVIIKSDFDSSTIKTAEELEEKKYEYGMKKP